MWCTNSGRMIVNQNQYGYTISIFVGVVVRVFSPTIIIVKLPRLINIYQPQWTITDQLPSNVDDNPLLFWTILQSPCVHGNFHMFLCCPDCCRTWSVNHQPEGDEAQRRNHNHLQSGGPQLAKLVNRTRVNPIANDFPLLCLIINEEYPT